MDNQTQLKKSFTEELQSLRPGAIPSFSQREKGVWLEAKADSNRMPMRFGIDFGDKEVPDETAIKAGKVVARRFAKRFRVEDLARQALEIDDWTLSQDDAEDLITLLLILCQTRGKFKTSEYTLKLMADMSKAPVPVDYHGQVAQ